MYYYLLEGCKEFKKVNTKKLDVDKMNRSCNKYAVRNTVKCWKEQYKGKNNANN